jgi:hypothetical protein
MRGRKIKGKANPEVSEQDDETALRNENPLQLAAGSCNRMNEEIDK